MFGTTARIVFNIEMLDQVNISWMSQLMNVSEKHTLNFLLKYWEVYTETHKVFFFFHIRHMNSPLKLPPMSMHWAHVYGQQHMDPGLLKFSWPGDFTVWAHSLASICHTYHTHCDLIAQLLSIITKPDPGHTSVPF